MMNTPKTKSSVLLVWILSYSSLLLVILGIFPFVFFWTRNLVEEEIQRSHTLTLQQIQIDNDRLFTDFEFQSILNAQNDRVVSLINAGKDLSPEQLFDAHKVSQEFRNISTSNSSLDRIILFLHESELVITNETIGMGNVLLPRIMNEIGIDMDDFLSLISQNHLRSYWSTKNQPREVEKHFIFFIRSLPLLDQVTNTATLVFMINTNSLDTISQQITQETGGSVFVIDRNQQIIYGSGPIDFETTRLALTQSPNLQGIYQIQLNGQDTIILSKPSRNLGWTYFLATPTTQFWDRLQQISQIMIFATLIGLIIGIILIMFFLKKQYSPLQDILTFINSQGLNTGGQPINEYEQIRSKVQSILSEKAEAETQLLQRNTLLQGYLLEKALRGQSSLFSIEDTSNAFNIHWISPYFLVVGVSLEKDDDPSNPEMDLSDQLAMDLTIQWFINQEIKNNHVGIMANIGDVSVILFNLEEKYINNYYEIINKFNSKIFGFASQHNCFKIFTGTSSIVNLGNITQAYKESLDSLEYAITTHSKQIIFYENLLNTPIPNYFYTNNDEDQLMNAITRGQTEESLHIFTLIHEKNAKIPLSHSNRKCFWYDLLATLLKAMVDIPVEDKKKLRREWESIHELIDNDQTQYISNTIKEFIRILTEALAKLENTKSRTVSPLVEDYISKNYHSFELNLTSIADALELHPSYVSQRFRSETGFGILDYINDYRIEKAKEIIKNNPTLTLDQICNLVGYASNKTFTRICKKKLGMTPGKFFGKE